MVSIYDNNGNIFSISDGTNTTSYVYDSANQLIRENNQAGGFTRAWTYDNAGNIRTREEYAYTTGELGTPTDTVTYTYGDGDWGDLLTAYDGETIEYDNVGNPVNDGTWTYTWEHGRQLASMTDGTTTITYTYNAEGVRIGKTVSRSNYIETHKYFYHNGNMTCDIITVIEDGVTTDHSLKISYDESGRPFVVTYKNRSYYYLLNAQGDVMGISGVYGDLKVAYTYDAWGNVLSVTGPLADTLGYWNPCRYRGYVYDKETGYYYLQSRYYDPEIGRFINADALVATGQGLLGNNMFAYCGNNPVVYSDESGNIPQAVTDKLVHDRVLASICANQASLSWTGTCIYYNGENFWGGWGFCDLYNTQTGEVWELKKDSNSYSCKTSTALSQLARYTRGRLKDNKKLKLHMPYKTTINSGGFSFTKNGYIYDVSYWSEGNGILRYKYTCRKTEARKTAEAVATAAALVALMIVAPYAAPVYSGAGLSITTIPLA